MTAMLMVEDLRVRRGRRTVLDVPHFAVETGEILAVIGPNGAGKSTLIQALALLLPAEMRYHFAGRPVRLPHEAPALRRQMAVVFQEPLLLDMSVYDNVALGLRLRRVPRPEIGRRVEQWLETLGVQGLARRSVRTLSGGEAQRVNLARALALAPRVLFLDEPFGALDVLTRVTLMQELRPVLRSAGVTALFVTHDYTELPALADRVASLSGGQVAQVGSPAAVLRERASAEVGALVRAAKDLVQALEGPEQR